MRNFKKGDSVRLVTAMGRKNILKYGKMLVLKVTSRSAAWASGYSPNEPSKETIVDVKLSNGEITWFPIEDLTKGPMMGRITLNTRKLY